MSWLNVVSQQFIEFCITQRVHDPPRNHATDEDDTLCTQLHDTDKPTSPALVLRGQALLLDQSDRWISSLFIT